jgi:hypothetical protein
MGQIAASAAASGRESPINSSGIPVRALNFVLPLAYGIGLILGICVYGAVAKLFMFAGVSESVAITLGGWVALFSVLGVAFVIVKRNIRLPTASSRKSLLGHFMLAVGNVAAVATTVVPLAIGYVTGHSDYGLYMWFALPVLVVNLLLWPVGWKFATSADIANA